MTEVKRFDAVPIKATRTPEGYIMDSPVLGRAGIQTYRKPDGTEWKEYRPPEVVFAADHLAAIRGRPIIEGHIPRVDSANVRKHSIGTIMSPGRQDGENLIADIVIHDPGVVLNQGMRELSLGYRVIAREVPGTTPAGERYDTIIDRIVAVDHLAVVPRGRAGVARLNLDADDAVSFPLDQEDSPPMAATNVQVRTDAGLTYDAPPEVANELARVRQERTAAVARADKAEAERDTLKTAAEGHKAALDAARAEGAKTAAARAALDAEATKRGVATRADMSDRQVREAVVSKVAGSVVDFAGKSDEYVLARYDLALGESTDRADALGRQTAAVNGAGQPPRGVVQGAGPAAPRSAAAAREAAARRRHY